MDLKTYFLINEEVQKALQENKPIVALESTIISHGMPYPKNVETALLVEDAVRNNQATPATIAIINGIIKIGLTKDDIEYLGKNQSILKTSKRDIPYIVSQKRDGATTVSATAYLASQANIKIFATGGIGGVHRKAETTFDISNDLEEIATTNVSIVCAGVKSILDLPKTLEYLETKGIEVIGYQTSFLPAFYFSKSDFYVNHRLDSPEAIANLINVKSDLGIKSGVLITNPIPLEYEVDPIKINKAIDEALIEMDKLNITGNKTTPYLLAKVKEITKGTSLEANIKLVINNAILAAKIANYLK